MIWPFRKKKKDVAKSIIKRERGEGEKLKINDKESINVPPSFLSQALKRAPKISNVFKGKNEKWHVKAEVLPGKDLMTALRLNLSPEVSRRGLKGKIKARLPKKHKKYALIKQDSSITRRWVLKHKNEIAREVGKTLAELNKLGIIHGDVNLSNVLISKDKNGKPKVSFIDWEFSRMRNASDSPKKDYGLIRRQLKDHFARTKKGKKKIAEVLDKAFEEEL